MSLSAPWALLAAALAAPLVIGYLTRRRNVRKVVPSAILFRAIVADETTSRRALAKPQHRVSLILAVLALLAAVFALAAPTLSSGAPGRYIFVLDTSASMATVGDGSPRSRLSRAVDELETFASGLDPRDEVALVVSGAEATVQLGLTTDHARAVELARAARPGGPGGGDSTALRIADAMCGDDSNAAIIVLSDGAGFSSRTTRCPLWYVPVGGLAPQNLGITALSAREADALGLAEVFVAVTSTYAAPREIEVALELDGSLLEVVAMRVAANGSAERLVRLALPPGDQLTARIVGVMDSLPLDDVATAPVQSGGRVRALLITDRDASFMAEALRLHPRVDLEVVRSADLTADGAIAYDLAVVEDGVADPHTLPPARRVLALGVPATGFGVGVGKPVTEPEVIRWDFEAPLFRFIDFGHLHILGGHHVAVPEGGHSLVDTAGGSIAATARADGRDIVVTGFSLDDSDMVLRIAFPNFVANVVEWAAPIGRRGGPDAAGDGNVLSAEESRAQTTPTIGTGARDGFPKAVRAGAPPWRFLVAIAIGLLMLEWLLPAFARRRRRSR